MLVVRHGQASFGAEDYDVLSPLGWEQARLLGAHLGASGTWPVSLVHGTLRRQRETVEGMLEGLSTARPGSSEAAPTVRVDPDWDEFDHLGLIAAQPDLTGLDAEGGTAGLDRRGFQQVFLEATGRWARDESAASDSAYPETFAEFLERTSRALTEACADAVRAGGVVVAVTSGGPIGAVAATLVDPEADHSGVVRLWERFNTVCVNSSVSRVLVGATGTRLLSFNEHTHLDRDRVSYR